MIPVATLSTNRFTMRPLRRGDAGALFATLSDPEQCQYLTRPAFSSISELWDWLSAPDWAGRTWIAEDADGVAGRFVASPIYPGSLAKGVIEIGYIVCTHRQAEGVARECIAALISHLFAVPVGEGGASKITAEVDTRNAASVHLLERFGFTREAHLREHETTHIGLCDVYLYGLLKSDWADAASTMPTVP